MKIIGHYNIQHIRQHIKVVVLDVSDTEAKCIEIAPFESKIGVASQDAELVVDQLRTEFPEFVFYNFDMRNAQYPLWFWDKMYEESLTS